MVPLFSLRDAYLLGMAAWLLAGAASLGACLKLRRRWKDARGKRRLVAAALSLWFLLATLTLLELATALFYDQTDSFAQTNVARRWNTLHVRTNEAGFRDEQPLSRPRLPGQRHVVFVGDSFTFGHGVKDPADRFSDRVAAALEARRPGRFTVSNVGLPGVDVRALVESGPGRPSLLQDVVRHGSPVDVLVYTFVLNDVEYLDERTAAFYQSLAAEQPQCPLFRHTYLPNLLYYRLRSSRRSTGEYYDYLVDAYDPSKSPAWERLRTELDALQAFCRDRRIELRVALFPFLHNLGPDYPFADAHRRLKQEFDARGVRCLDLRAALEPHVGDGLTVNRFDAHPNARAHALAADAILASLLADLLNADAGSSDVTLRRSAHPSGRMGR